LQLVARHRLVVTLADPRADDAAHAGLLELGDQAAQAALTAVVGEQATQRASQAAEIAQSPEASALRLLLCSASQHLTEYRIEQSHGRFLGV
jgi:hypothetical protein